MTEAEFSDLDEISRRNLPFVRDAATAILRLEKLFPIQRTALPHMLRNRGATSPELDAFSPRSTTTSPGLFYHTIHRTGTKVAN